MEFESKRLMFREFKQEDYEAFASVFSDERVMEYAYMDRITDRDEMLGTSALKSLRCTRWSRAATPTIINPKKL